MSASRSLSCAPALLLLSVAAAQKAPDPLHELSSTLEDLSRRAGRAVVPIYSTGYAVAPDDAEQTTANLLSRQRSAGSGIILSPNGFIVTNAHVVQGARRIQVMLPAPVPHGSPGRSTLKPPGRMVVAKLVGVDRETDLAVIKIDGSNLPHLVLGDSDEVRQGQLVLALGNPLGLQNSVSLGVVSSTARQIRADDSMIYIQTDAPINPGNSGGPLLDVDGRVVGINTFILSQSGGSEGIGFSIPSNIVQNVFGQIVKAGHVHRGRIGVHAQTITPDLAAGLGLSQDWGVVLGDVDPEGPADSAGLKVGDIVLTLNGKVMENARQLEVNVYRHAIGEKLRLGVLRGGENLTMEVPVIEQEDDPQRFADMVSPEANLVAKLGILGVAIDKKIAAMLPDLRNPYGIVVAARAADAPYSGRGLEPGDVIYSVNGVMITSMAALRASLDKTRTGDAVVLQLERDGRLMYLTLDLD